MRTPIPSAGIEAEVAALSGLGTAALRQRWQALTGDLPAPGLKGELLRAALAHRLQEQAFGGLRRDLLPRLVALASEENEGSSAGVIANPPRRRIKAGSRLLREWRGRMHEVVVTPDGYLWAGEVHDSLSTIATRITGTSWNGWRFFGLKERKPRHLRKDFDAGSNPRPASPAPEALRHG